MVRFEKPRVFLLKSCWTSSTAAELNFSWVELLQLQLSFSAELNFSWVELVQLQLNFNFNWGLGRFNRGPGQVQPGSREVQPVSGPVFAVWLAVCQSDWQTGCQACQGRFNRSQVKKSAQRLVLSSPYIYSLLALSPKRRARFELHFQLEKHLPLSLTHLLPLPFQIFGEKSLSELESCGFLCFISKSLSLFFIQALVLHRVLCGFITLGASSS
jgi:hypothetical protein